MYLLHRTNGVFSVIRVHFRLHRVTHLSATKYGKSSTKGATFFNRQSILHGIWIGQHSPMRICALDRGTVWRHDYTPTTRYHRYLWRYFLVHRLRRQYDVCW